MNETRRGFIDLHLGVLLAGFTGLFGRLITLNEVDIVWYRMLFSSICLLFITAYRLEEYPQDMRMRSSAGTALDTVLRLNQGLECINRRRLLFTHRILYGVV